MSYITVLILLHIAGAIVGIGPTFTFGVIGSMMPTAGPGSMALMEAMAKIEKVLVNPVAMVVQPVTGVLLIVETNRHKEFFSNEWLVIAIVAYITIMVLSYGVMGPGLHKMIVMAKEGKAQTPEFGALAKVQQRFGPMLGVLTLVIIVMMVWKPGDNPGL